jgi:hypothetical protein
MKTGNNLSRVSISIAALLVSFFVPRPAAPSTKIVLFSDVSSEKELALSYLTVQVDFALVDSYVVITIENDSPFEISALYFNTTDQVAGLSIDESPDPSWAVAMNAGNGEPTTADGFGVFDWVITFGEGTSRLPAYDIEEGASLTVLALTMTAVGRMVGADLLDAPTSAGAWAALKFVSVSGSGLDMPESVFGAAVAEPTVQ